jgi:hypothetical protein
MGRADAENLPKSNRDLRLISCEDLEADRIAPDLVPEGKRAPNSGFVYEANDIVLYLTTTAGGGLTCRLPQAVVVAIDFVTRHRGGMSRLSGRCVMFPF